MKRNEKQGHTSKSDMDWMYKNINPYYDKIRNEETMKLEDVVKNVLEGKKKKGAYEDTDKDEPGTQGDDKEYAKKRDAVLKKFGVKSCAACETEEEKKACFKALDDAHVADHEEEVNKAIEKTLEKKEEVELEETKYQVTYSKNNKLFSKTINAKNEDDAEDKAIKKFKIEDDDIRSVVKEEVKTSFSKMFTHVKSLMQGK